MRHRPPIREWGEADLISAQLRLPRVVPCKDEVEAGLSRKPRDPSQAEIKEGIGLPPHSQLRFTLDIGISTRWSVGRLRYVAAWMNPGECSDLPSCPIFTAAFYPTHGETKSRMSGQR